MRGFVASVVLAALVSDTACAAVSGFDVSIGIDSSTASCFAQESKDWMACRAWKNNASYDSNCCTSINLAQNSGIATRSAYMTPCPQCSQTARTQLDNMFNGLQAGCQSAWSGTAYLQISASASSWYSTTSENQRWYQTLVDGCTSRFGITCAILSSYNDWVTLFGDETYTYGNTLDLWYVQNDGEASFSGFQPFGGWTSPSVKQYTTGSHLCGISSNLDYIA